MVFYDKRTVVVGLGKSGLSVCRYLCGQDVKVTLSELREKSELDQASVGEILRLGAALETGGHREETFLGAEMIVVSPGVPLDIRPLKAARKAGIPILGEMELAGRLINIPIAAVTGTNGKSTVTALLGFMAERAKKSVFVGGNIGTPLMDCILEKPEADLVVVEVSSFQLDTMETFCPHVSLILNISADHLDRYRDYEAYAASKLRIFENQGARDVVILNDEDVRLSRVRPGGGTTVLRYGMQRRKGLHAFMEAGQLTASLPGREVDAFEVAKFPLPGNHNLQNLMAAVLAGLFLGIDHQAIQASIDNFFGLPHRMEFVGRIHDIKFYNDSKATNVEAAARAVEGFDRPVILIAGGRDKGGDYGPLVAAARTRVKQAVLLGEARPLLAHALEGVVSIVSAESMTEAVEAAFAAANPDDVVLLAPACSSFDMFTDYKHRGKIFKEAVKKLGHGDQDQTT